MRRILAMMWCLAGLSLAQNQSAGESNSGVVSQGLFDKPWLRLGVGTYFNADPYGLIAGSVGISPDVTLRGDLEVRTEGGGVSLSVMPTVAMSFADQLKDASTVNPYFRAGLLVWHHNPERGNSDTGFHIVFGGGAEVALGPQVLFEPYLLVFWWDANHAVLGFDGNYKLSQNFALGIGFSMSDIDLDGARIQGTATLIF